VQVRTAAEPWTLGAAYERCRQLHARHGRTYYLATLLLPRWKRRHVHALYGFTRYADEIVDDLATTLDGAGQAAALRAWGRRLFAGLHGAPVQDPLLPAVLHTVRAFDLDPGDFQRFLDAMAADLTVGGYRTYQELCGYMEGSAGVIGTMLAPILESCDPPAAREHARQLGLAFQLTNFIRDLGEDFQRGRVYLPAEDLARFGVGRAGYQVLDRRVAVPRHRRLQVAGRHWAAARAAARAERRVSVTTPGTP
jgi:phytoene synthase